jgi:DNA-binding transcriptional LysR family regulator
LIQRTTRQFTVTEVGQTFYQHCKAMLIEAEAAQQAVETLRSSRAVASRSPARSPYCMSISGRCWRGLCALPGVNVQLEATNRRVMLLAKGLMWRFAYARGRLMTAIW